MNPENWILLGGYLIGAVLVFIRLLDRPGDSKIAWLPNRVALLLDCALNGLLWPVLAVNLLWEELR